MCAIRRRPNEWGRKKTTKHGKWHLARFKNKIGKKTQQIENKWWRHFISTFSSGKLISLLFKFGVALEIRWAWCGEIGSGAAQRSWCLLLKTHKTLSASILLKNLHADDFIKFYLFIVLSSASVLSSLHAGRANFFFYKTFKSAKRKTHIKY